MTIIIILILVIVATITSLFVAFKNEKKYTNNKKIYDFPDTFSDKGERGENYIKNIIGETIPGEQYVINNLILSNKEGTKSTEIDHIVINRHGFFVIETKYRSGNISGDYDTESWTQSYDYSCNINKFNNPVKQNETHIKNLQRALETNIPMRSVVVFIDSNLDNVDSDVVVDVKNLDKILHSGNFPLPVSELERYYKQLNYLKSIQITHKQHLNNIYNNHNY